MPFPLTAVNATYNTASKFGQSLNGGYGYTSTPIVSGYPYTLRCIVKAAANGTVEVAAGQSGFGWIGKNADGTAQARYGFNTTDIGLTSTINIADGNWHELELNVTATGGGLIVDGVVAATSTSPGTPVTSRYFGVRAFFTTAASNAATFPWSGEIDQVAVFNAAQHGGAYTPSTTALTGAEPNLVALYSFDGNTLDTAGAPATAVLMTGPTSGSVGVASANFSFSLNGTYTGTVIVTPSDGGAGGTFNPSTVSVTAGNTSSAAYTAASSGVKTISAANNAGLSNPSNISYTASALAAPGVPTIGTATAGNGQVSTTFTPSGSGGAATSFTATWTPATGSPVTATGSASPIVIGGLTAGTTGTVHVTATNATSTSAASAESNSVTLPTPVSVAITDSKLFWSPYNWDNRGSYKVSACSGSYVKISFTGTSIAVNLDTSALTSSGIPAISWPRVRAIYDGITAVDTQLTSSMTAVTRTGLAAGNHTLEFYLDATDDETGDFWTTPSNYLGISGFTLDQGATVSQWVPLAKNMIWYGDSISRGYKSLATTNVMPQGSSNAITIPPSFAKAFGAELGLVAYSGQGFSKASGSVPALLTAYDSYSSGRSRLVNGLLVPAPDFIASMHGTNGTPTQADVQSFLTKARAMAPNAVILMIVPASGAARSALTAAVAAQADAKVLLVDIGTGYSAGISSFTQVQNYWSWDGLHYNALSNTRIGFATAKSAQSALDASGPTLSARTATFQLATGQNADGSPIYAANLTGAKISVYDEASPDLHTVARYKTAAGAFDATGNCTLTYQSTLAAGGTCSVVVWVGTKRYTNSVVVS